MCIINAMRTVDGRNGAEKTTIVQPLGPLGCNQKAWVAVMFGDERSSRNQPTSYSDIANIAYHTIRCDAAFEPHACDQKAMMKHKMHKYTRSHIRKPPLARLSSSSLEPWRKMATS